MIVFDFRGEEPNRQHRSLLDCALARDAARAGAILHEHLTRCIDHAVASGKFA
jgi:DNA-binding GntR family transcriptional regulator